MIIEAILKINPNAVVSVSGNDINTCEITWQNGTTPIPVADIQAQFPAVEFDMAMEDLRAKEINYYKTQIIMLYQIKLYLMT